MSISPTHTVRTIGLAVALMVAGTSLASAGPKSSDAERRAAAQAREIEAGRQNGSITFFEGQRLRREQLRIAATKRQLAADGKLDRHDRRQIEALQQQASSNIRSQSLDGWKRWSLLPRVGR